LKVVREDFAPRVEDARVALLAREHERGVDRRVKRPDILELRPAALSKMSNDPIAFVLRRFDDGVPHARERRRLLDGRGRALRVVGVEV
jgi:hypothetical protein